MSFDQLNVDSTISQWGYIYVKHTLGINCNNLCELLYKLIILLNNSHYFLYIVLSLIHI